MKSKRKFPISFEQYLWRKRQIDIVTDSEAYLCLLNAYPNEYHRAKVTKDVFPFEDCSKRAFRGRIDVWKTDLRMFMLTVEICGRYPSKRER